MTWQEASGTYWMAVLIMAILGYIKQKALLYHDADPRLRTYSRNPTLPCDYLGAFSLGEFLGYLIQDFGIPLPVFANKILGRALTVLTDDIESALVAIWVLLTALVLPLVVEIFVDRWYYGTDAFEK